MKVILNTAKKTVEVTQLQSVTLELDKMDVIYLMSALRMHIDAGGNLEPTEDEIWVDTLFDKLNSLTGDDDSSVTHRPTW